MSEQPANADPSLEEQLVAYLDGELDAQASQQIEERLATDPETRETLQRLDRTWELLDELERPDVQQRFTQTTLEMVTSAAAEEVKQFEDGAPRRWRRRWIVALGGLLLSGLVGFVAVALLVPDPDRRLVEDLPVLQNLDQYRQIDGVRFLQMAHEEGLFAEEEAVVMPVGADGDESRADRRRQIESMSPAQKEQLRQLQQRFARLPAAEQQRLQQVHRQFQSHADARQLLSVMHRYCNWLMTLPPFTRAELQELEPAERIERIRELVKQEAEKPTREDVEGFFRWIDEYVKMHEQEILQSLPEPMQTRMATMDPAKRYRGLAGFFTFRMRSQRPGPGWTPALSESDLADLRSHLSERTRKLLETKDPTEQRRIIAGWPRQLARQRYSFRRLRGDPLPAELQQQLDRFFEQLDDEQQDHLLSLPGDEMQRELWDLFRRKFSPSEPAMRRPPGPGRRPGRERGGPPGPPPHGTRSPPPAESDPMPPDGPNRPHRGPPHQPPSATGGVH